MIMAAAAAATSERAIRVDVNVKVDLKDHIWVRWVQEWNDRHWLKRPVCVVLICCHSGGCCLPGTRHVHKDHILLSFGVLTVVISPGLWFSLKVKIAG